VWNNHGSSKSKDSVNRLTSKSKPLLVLFQLTANILVMGTDQVMTDLPLFFKFLPGRFRTVRIEFVSAAFRGGAMVRIIE
jgi:hypothetical protein